MKKLFLLVFCVLVFINKQHAYNSQINTWQVELGTIGVNCKKALIGKNSFCQILNNHTCVSNSNEISICFCQKYSSPKTKKAYFLHNYVLPIGDLIEIVHIWIKKLDVCILQTGNFKKK
ncbi:MAG: hypothetical protein N2167_11095 [Flavobacteriales bacterium]|nr:hypothetical protein [Flavobacteriales bacterium]